MGTPGNIVRGSGSVFLIGTAGDDTFLGGSILEVFYTGLGDDKVYAGAGDDIVNADLGNDWLDGGPGEGDRLSFEFVNTSEYHPAGDTPLRVTEFGVTVDLAKAKQDMGYFGVKTIFSFEYVTGTPHADKIYGNAKDNGLTGGGGNDRLDGRSGADALYGGEGSDTLIGGDGNDTMIGDSGGDRFFSGLGGDEMSGSSRFDLQNDGSRDTYVYSSIKYSGTTDFTRDVIYGYFDGANGDKIDLSGMDANGSKSGDGKFTFIGANSIGSNDVSQVQVRATGQLNEYFVKIDIDRDNGSEMQIMVYSNTALTASDFIL